MRPPTLGQRQVGAINLMAVATLLLALLLLALVVDTGRLYYEQRKLQAMIDAAALSAARDSGYCGSGDAEAAALDAASRHGYQEADFVSGPNVRLGYVDQDANGVRRFHAEPARAEAVWVDATVAIPASIVAGFFWGENARLHAEAAARRVPQATFSASSTTAVVSSGNSGALNLLFSGLLNTDVELDLLGYEGLASAHVSLLALSEAASVVTGAVAVGSASSLLAAELTLVEALEVLATALDQSGVLGISGSVLREQLISANTPAARLRLGDVLSISTPEEAGALAGRVNLLDLLQAVVMVANRDAVIALPEANLNIPGVTDLRVELYLTEAPVIAVGPPGRDAEGAWRTRAQTAQGRMQIVGSVPVPLLGTELELINLAVELVGGEAWLEQISCPTLQQPASTVTLGARSSPYTVRAGVLSLVSGGEPSPLIVETVLDGFEVDFGIHLDLAGASQDGWLVYPVSEPDTDLPWMQPLQLGSAGTQSVLDPGAVEIRLETPLNSLPIVGAVLEAVQELLSGALRAALMAPLEAVFTLVLDPLLATLGVSTGVVEVELMHLDEGAVELVL